MRKKPALYGSDRSHPQRRSRGRGGARAARGARRHESQANKIDVKSPLKAVGAFSGRGGYQDSGPGLKCIPGPFVVKSDCPTRTGPGWGDIPARPLRDRL